ncbi:hypothetical protein [Elizabethkingia anophelis]|uniref:hypothetical protein n=1 Tax=Elizabethkingia anophelis TaxID=1117645 RepID=UPI001EE773B4|nr:hypothetical protein [Elizabethkingia anophelis]UKY87452.1 hypothetical protein KUF63_04210 [Elizabethkingia anophelis]UKZ01562.1 hypothetical protein KUF65_04215 [Elizabethkingia anophelis]
MRTIILMLLSVTVFSCAAWNKKSKLNEEKNSGSEELTKIGTADTKIKRTVTDFSESTSGKMKFLIIPGNSNQNSVTPKEPRKVKVKDAAGNEAEYDLRGDEIIKFGSENTSDTRLSKMQDSISLIQNNFEHLQKEFSDYKKQKETESKKIGLQTGVYITFVIWGIAAICIIGLLVYLGKTDFVKNIFNRLTNK